MNKSLTELIEESDFLPLAQEYAQDFLRIYNSIHEDGWPRSRKFYAHLIEETEELESFLDDHSARDNRTWFAMGELVACVRNLVKVAFILTHIVNRLPAYDLEDKAIAKFEKSARMASEYFDETILRFFEAIKAENPSVPFDWQIFPWADEQGPDGACARACEFLALSGKPDSR